MRRDKRAENLEKGDKVFFSNKKLEVRNVKRFTEGRTHKIRVSFKSFRDVDFDHDWLVTVTD